MKKKDLESRKDVEQLVKAFYEKVLADELISPFFTQTVQVDWDKHFPVMFDFWESVLFEKAVYQGNAMKTHLDLNNKKQLEKEHFERWLSLFSSTIDELFDGQKAELAKTRALSIATVIQMKTYSK